MTFLTYFGIGLLVSVVVGVIGGIFWPDRKYYPKRKRRRDQHHSSISGELLF